MHHGPMIFREDLLTLDLPGDELVPELFPT